MKLKLDFAQALILDMLKDDLKAAKHAMHIGEFAMAAHELREAAEKADQIQELFPDEDEESGDKEGPTIDV